MSSVAFCAHCQARRHTPPRHGEITDARPGGCECSCHGHRPPFGVAPLFGRLS